jgi:hypothetical protein
MNMTAAIQVSPRETPRGESKVWKMAIFSLFVASLLAGLAAIFHIPLSLFPLLLPLAGVFWIFKRAVKHNRGLLKLLGARALVRNLLATLVLLLPMLPLVVPGLLGGIFVSSSLNRCVENLNEWSAPSMISVQTKKSVEQPVKQRIKRILPWWYAPAVWLHLADDYATQVRVEVQTITETINQATPKPWLVRALAGALKFFLQSLSIASFTWCALLFLQLFFGLFGRRLLSQHGALKIALCRDHGVGQTTSQKSETDASASLRIKLRPNETLYVRSSDLPTGAVPDVSFRLKDGAFVARFLYKLVMLSRVTSANGDEIAFHASAGAQYISVRLEQGQQVTVNPHALAAYSNSVHFQRHWDFNVAVVGLHHIFYLIAEGPGLIVLRANGGSIITTNASDMPALPIERLLLFDARASFHALASDGALNYVLSPCVLKADEGNIFVAGPVASHRESVFGKLGRFIKHCYLPI